MWKKPDNEGLSATITQQPSQSGGPIRSRETVSEKAMIGASIVLKGDLTGDEDLLIEGQVEGTITLKDNSVTIGKNGRVTANIYAKVISVEGEMTGDLFGGEQVIVHKAGRVRGNITSPRVTLEDGAKLKGTIDMDPKPGENRPVQNSENRQANKQPPAHAAGA